jgi:two-component system capsular synthesis response regulator RcsB
MIKIKKVLIVEDHEIANLSLQATLKEAGVGQPDYAYYCDNALVMIERNKNSDQPYDLLITDLYFENDHNKQQLTSGQALIAAARKVQPDLKVLVFSAERNAAVVKKLFNAFEIDGYVRKARNDARDLMSAIEKIDTGQRYLPWWFLNLLKDKNTYEFSPWDVAVLSLMAQGIRQKEMPARLLRDKINPSGLSSIEKGLKNLREALNFSNNEQLIAYCVEIGVV